MDQELVFKDFYQQISAKIEGIEKQLAKDKIKSKDTKIELVIDDIRQCVFDINAKRIIVGEQFFDPPSLFHLVFSVLVSGNNYEEVLSCYGYTARILNDDRNVALKNCIWHNYTIDHTVFNPVVCGASDENPFANSTNKMTFKLVYEVTLGLNSRNSSTFTRVKEEATVRGKVMK